ncbi:MAG: glycosyltransferase family 4 protein [Chloroflexota bacterium]|nr:glycosyltransferase family 4 protein [Chloroflexota bacterium]
MSRTRGIGRYSRGLLAAFARRASRALNDDPQWTLLRLRSFPAAAPQPLPPHRDVSVLRPRRPELAMLALDAVALPLEIGFRGEDVYHSVQLGLPAARRMRAVLTIHDLAPLRWPAHYLRLPHSRIGHMWQYALAQRADAVIVPSLSTARDVVERLRIPAARVHAIPEAVDASFAPPSREEGRRLARERFGVPERYVLYVGQFDPRKNMDGLFSAYARAADADPALRLVVVGDLGKLAVLLRRALERTRAPRERVIVTGFVDDPTLAALYAGAECLLHAALLEGFGLTPLESLAAGTPVVGYEAGAVEEVVGDAGVLVDPAEPDALGEALVNVLGAETFAEELRARAKPRAAKFSWDEAAERTIEVYRSVA